MLLCMSLLINIVVYVVLGFGKFVSGVIGVRSDLRGFVFKFNSCYSDCALAESTISMFVYKDILLLLGCISVE